MVQLGPVAEGLSQGHSQGVGQGCNHQGLTEEGSAYKLIHMVTACHAVRFILTA